MASFKSILLTGVLAGAVAANAVPTSIPTKVTACTHTIKATERASTSQALTWPPILTMTSYTATVTKDVFVDCGGCHFLAVDRTIHGFPSKEGHLPTSVTVYQAPEPTTVTRTHCSGFFDDNVKPEVTPRWEDAGFLGLRQEVPTSTPSVSECTSELFRFPQYTFGPTRTIWTTTAVATETVDCGNCTHVATKLVPIGPGPVVRFTTTVTADGPSLTTTFVCGTPTASSLTNIAAAPSSPAVETKGLPTL